MKQFNPEFIIKFLIHNGWIIDHTTGSHKIMYNENSKKRTVVPFHKKDLPIGTLLAILKQTGLTKQNLLDFKK
ncbi:type II toxin-antitoxin system HicA family toxin [Candidatus Gracilibacteria bacterium]|nr:type II toxin-antitoxin system HicA family toxin [Candidatus Gracilibacteria bacterium]